MQNSYAKKSIFVFAHSLEIGGAERALLGLLNSIDYTKYDVDLFLLRHEGELLKYLPKEVNLLAEDSNYSCLGSPIVDTIKKGKIGIAIGRLFAKIKARFFNKKMGYSNSLAVFDYSHKYTKLFMPMMSEKTYDMAISFLIPHYFVSEKVKSKKKIAWIHTDYSYLDLDVSSELKMWGAYDNIISISESVTKAFLNKFPSLENKIKIIENINSKTFIESQAALQPVPKEFDSDTTNLLSVGRFSDAKNFDNVPEIAAIIKSKGIDFKWYIIGYGGEEALIRSKISEFGMENTVILLGKKENPYPYIKACDIYVQPSRYEGKAVTVCEALLLNKPVIITNYPTAKSQLKDGFDGVIVPLNNQGCADGIAKAIKDKKLQQNLIENMQKTNYSNENEVEKLYSLID